MDLTPLSDLLAAATEGEWYRHANVIFAKDEHEGDTEVGSCEWSLDARLVCVLRNLAPDLVAVLQGIAFNNRLGLGDGTAECCICGCKEHDPSCEWQALQRKARDLGVELK